MGMTRSHRKSYDRDWDTHCLTFSTLRRQAFFPGRHAAQWFLDALAEARERCPFHLFAWVIMPEHVHVVLQPCVGVRMRSVLWRLKRPVTARVLEWVRGHRPSLLPRMADAQPSGRITYRFWQRGGGYDRNLRSALDVHEKINYIHNNPVRRGLVKCAEAWPYSSAPEWVGGREGAVRIDWDHLGEPDVR